MRKRKPITETKQEREARQYREWREKHEAAYMLSMKRLSGISGSSTQFFAKQAQADASRRREAVIANSPKPQPVVRAKVNGIDDRDMSLEQLEELRKREEAAQEEIRLKKARTGAVYNKGNSVYISDGMLDDIKSGSHRRR